VTEAQRRQAGQVMRVSAWSNGTPTRSGAGYGLRITPLDRDRHFHREWPSADLELAGSGTTTTVQLSASFWNRCTELRSAAIGRWLIERNLAPWPAAGSPPTLTLTSLAPARFRLDLSPVAIGR
jgi:hypothetical protein